MSLSSKTEAIFWTKFDIKLISKDIFEDLKIGIDFDKSSIFSSSSLLKPVVAITIGILLFSSVNQEQSIICCQYCGRVLQQLKKIAVYGEQVMKRHPLGSGTSFSIPVNTE